MSEQNNTLMDKNERPIQVSNGRKINKKNESYELEEINKLMPNNEPITPMQEINKAYEVCKFGWFHVKLLFVSFFGCIASILVTNTTSYLLPIAECDLNMNLKQKGLLNAMPYFGMFVSTVIAGFLIDTFGRIYFLRIGFGGIFLCTLFSASSQTYEMLAAAKLCEGILFATSLAAISCLTSEFCHSSIRDRVMLCQSSYAALTQILSPAMAWGILIQDWRYSFFDGAFVLNVWNFYLLAMSLWSLTAFLLYLMLPESPKFLVTQKRYVEARNILIKIYVENSRKPADTFPYPEIFEKEIKEAATEKEDASKTKFGTKILAGLRNMKPLFHRPLLGYLGLIGLMQFITLGIHNVIRLWFPQLSTIVEHYKLDGNQNLCDLLDAYTGTLKVKNNPNSTTGVCVPHVSGSETYINSIIIGLISILPYFISGVIVNKVGKKALLFVGGVISSGALLGLRWSSSKAMMVAFFSVNIAITQTMKSLTQVVLIDVVPTAMRTLALSLVMLTARVGTLVSNVAFPILLAMGCSIPFYTMAAMMSCVVMLSIFLPKKKQ
nr:major myo-inositol transporter IolT isoform X1 [Helicoverpa armigera]